ncbi:hypothetical protein FNV43_RR12251 [Rhamnella rubrinervis]|uniref:Neurochondrin n=1 Tax=Rhamnella rubrinervis TaxID=2594499 RepID=A0A8K0H7B0_9ROSA|nr:hypothetical protein FNV43_RR12251 [Rhamnella rubrinervis]
MDPQQQQPSPTLEQHCLNLLKGDTDTQRFAGLHLVTNFCKGDDLASLRRIYDAVGVRFLDRLLWTGMGKGTISGAAGENHDAYLQLSVTVLAAFCHVPEIAASEDMVLKIPLIVEILSKQSGSSVLEECCEFLYLVSSASEDGVMTLYKSGGMKVLASPTSTFSDGSRRVELALKLVELLLTKLSLEAICNDYLLEFSLIVVKIARQFAVLHDAVKFEALRLLSVIFSTKYSAQLSDALRVLPDDDWPNYMRDGIVAILQNRVAPADKFQALILAESMISILGEKWLIGQINLPNVKEPIPADRCLLLVLEQSRIEVAVLLNDLAYLKYEASRQSSFPDEKICLKQRNVAISFSLVEKIIKLISEFSESEEDLINDDTLRKVINGLNETIGVVLDYLQDAKEHGQRKGDDLLASVRVIGSYLAETPLACGEKVSKLLDYILSIEGEDEPSPFYSICFMLPLLCQMTMKVEGCKVLVSCGGHKAVIDCLIKLIGRHDCMVEDNGCIFLACDTILNLLLKKEQLQIPSDESTLVNLLKALACWTEDIDDPSVIMMASSICTLVFDFTSEEALLSHPGIDNSSLSGLSRLIAKSLAPQKQDVSNDAKANSDLLEIIAAGLSNLIL